MPLYHVVFLLLIIGAVVEHIKKQTPKRFFVFVFLVLTALLCFRFGQGTDYFSYAAIYHELPPDPIAAVNSTVHSEAGWKVLCALFRAAGAEFPVFVFFLSVYMMAAFFRFLHLYGGERKLLILVLCFHTLYMSYFVSALRQAIMIATFLGFMLPWLLKRNYIRYYITAVALVFIHSVALVLLIVPIVKEINLKIRHLVAAVSIGLLAGSLLSLIDIGQILQAFLPIVYLGESDVSFFALVERIATFAVVTVCYYLYLDGTEPESDDPLLVIYRIYAAGILLYGMLMWSPLISSRTVYVLKIVEVVLFGACIGKCKRLGPVVLLYCVLLSSFMYVKNVDSYLEQADYQNASIISYPYVSVFNQADIRYYRKNTIGYPFK